MRFEGTDFPVPEDVFGILDSKFPTWRTKRIHFAVLFCKIGKWFPLWLALAFVAANWNFGSWSPIRPNMVGRAGTVATYMVVATVCFISYMMILAHIADAYKFHTIVLRQGGQP